MRCCRLYIRLVRVCVLIVSMFSLLKKVLSILPSGSNTQKDDIKDEEEKIFNEIENLGSEPPESSEDLLSTGTKLGEKNEEFEVEVYKSFSKIGKITHLNSSFGLIDNVFHFEPSQVASDVSVNVNDEVEYLAYKVRENEAERVYKITSIKNAIDEFEDKQKTDLSNVDAVKINEIHALQRMLTDRVEGIREKSFYLKQVNKWIDIDQVEISFIPIEGDLVEILSDVSLNSDAPNYFGEVIDIKSVRPVLTKSGIGRISFWSDIKKEGVIENSIFFLKNSCPEDYNPSLGDEVEYDAIGSDQGNFKWRASSIQIKTNKKENDIELTPNESVQNNPFSDKNGISIVPGVCSVEVASGESKIVTLEVLNNGSTLQMFKIRMSALKHPSVGLINPSRVLFFINPKQKIQIQFRCWGRQIGLTGETILFIFKGFIIARRFEISTFSNLNMSKALPCKFETVFEFYKKETPKPRDKCDIVLYGPRVWKPPKFLKKVRKSVFKIPNKLWSIIEDNQSRNSMLTVVLEYAPYLRDELNFKNHSDKFHTLLYLEEIQLKIQFRMYAMSGVFPKREGEYFVFEVPGLAERRPSVMKGDKISLTQPWSLKNKINNMGIIHNTTAFEIYVKFHETFHSTYDGSACDIEFEPNTNFFSRSHEAVNRAGKILGEECLFPSTIKEKPPKVCLELDEIDLSGDAIRNSREENFDKLSENMSNVGGGKTSFISNDCNPKFGIKKKLKWVNKQLNSRQKLAIVNILEGRSRPLPYVIFGPPGTGKTVTLVELITQIYRLIPDSRLLVATPSNSAADLICERLIQQTDVKPGQLVRLVALYRVLDDLIPSALMPYTYFYTYDSHKSDLYKSDSGKIQTIVSRDLISQNRIIVSTCVNIGTLHYDGFSADHFTHILVDEAGQTLEPELLMSTTFQNPLKAQVVLAGDPLQLGPVVHNFIAHRFGLKTSFLQRLLSSDLYSSNLKKFPETSGYDPRIITKLNVNYRSFPELISLPSQMFYNSDLIPTVSETDSKEAEIIRDFDFRTEKRETPACLIFHGVIGQNYQEKDSPSWFNPHEIWQVVFYVRKLYKMGLSHDDIGILSPYRKQAEKIASVLELLELSIPKVSSVEEFQGQERMVIILTTVRSSPKHLEFDIRHSLGFVADPQRINVALTRARALLIIVGNPFLLSKDPYWDNVLKFCVQNGSYTGCNLKTFCSFLKTDEENQIDEDINELEALDNDFTTSEEVNDSEQS